MINNVVASAVITHSLSDHFPTVVQLNFKVNCKSKIRIIYWGNTSKTIKRSLQVKQNHIVKIICNKFGKKLD